MTINAGHKSDKIGKHEIIFMNVSKHKLMVRSGVNITSHSIMMSFNTSSLICDTTWVNKSSPQISPHQKTAQLISAASGAIRGNAGCKVMQADKTLVKVVAKHLSFQITLCSKCHVCEPTLNEAVLFLAVSLTVTFV